ncbi:thymidylate kinase [Aquimarina sp. EL_43]|uniref:ATP-binding protein n=1 Tax=unclassified Aquimarina TaxID=2627091 RepID=UPI0018CA55B4|nr:MULTISPECIES: ATP-binding protein [unclassified Aquimarina]MBG6130695.1 thymidylate kinase [Aquimarina sp. EL_35]MBG6151159.1 thymidylate kinase [Aquimarina sp. EL_32]MBG6169097.1 thymidylate kinase [Aquimarina sp. EL_43]
MNQPIICFEGPSGIGKTTMCNLLLNKYNIIPEVNFLFERTDNEPKLWYYERQLDRYRFCENSNKKSILDGDIFQPIWYNWVCNYPSSFASKKETHEFYRTKLSEGEIAFPDLYIVFYCDEKLLHVRKEKDKTRKRRNFEKHLEIIEPLKEYYRFLEKETDIELKFVEYENIEIVKRKVLNYINGSHRKKIQQLKTFEQIENWIDTKKK